MLSILGRPTSINVRKVLWTADEIGVPYRHEPQWGASSAVTMPEFRRLNPNALVPVVIDDGSVLWESNSICRYLAAKHGRHDLLPAEPLLRAEVEKWMDWQATSLNTAWRHAFMGLVRRHPDYKDRREIERSAEQWNALILILESVLAEGRPYIAGDHLTLADVVIGLGVHRWRTTPLKHGAAPVVADYADRLATRPPAARWMSDEFD